jgi:protease IV
MSSPANSTIVVQQPSGWNRFVSGLGWTLFFVTALALVIVSLMLMGFSIAYSDYFDTTEGITEKYVSGSESASDKVAIISIEGVIMEGDGFVKHQIDHIRKDDYVKAVVVRVDSPGGTITGSDYIYHHLNKLREEKQIDGKPLPMIVSMGAIAASGGYYVSMAVGDQERAIYAEPTSTTGSIGVIVPHYNISGLMKEYKVVDDSIASHERKQMLAMTKEMPAEHREIIQGYVNEAFVRFKDIIKTGRAEYRRNPEKLDQLATGEIFSATRAKENGLVDEIGFLEDAVDRAIELGGLDKEKVKVVKYKRPAALFDLGDIGAANAQQSQLGMLFELSQPKAYYLSTTLPAIFSTHRAD